ncbi:MAG: FtsL-like putative cell division protein [Bacteroidota bacterium]|nr:FtsL-like putative cell division protein [Bacteroidota bacterium]
MAQESYIKQLLNGEWLQKKWFTQHSRLFFITVGVFVFYLYQQYRVEALYFKATELKKELRIVRTEYVFTSVAVMNKTLESTVLNSLKAKDINLHIPVKPVQSVNISKQNKNNE